MFTVWKLYISKYIYININILPEFVKNVKYYINSLYLLIQEYILQLHGVYLLFFTTQRKCFVHQTIVV